MADCTCQPKDSGEAPDLPDPNCPVHGAFDQRESDEPNEGETVWAINPEARPALDALMGLLTGPVGRIIRERVNQIDHGYDAAHDLEHEDGELESAAMAYLMWDLGVDQAIKARDDIWPWDDFNPSDDSLRNLEKAGALIAAAIERILRQRGEMEDDEE